MATPNPFIGPVVRGARLSGADVCYRRQRVGNDIDHRRPEGSIPQHSRMRCPCCSHSFSVVEFQWRRGAHQTEPPFFDMRIQISLRILASATGWSYATWLTVIPREPDSSETR